MARISVEDLIKAGVHFGHRTSRWNPKMKPYIFKKRNLIHIIDLKQTVRGLLTGRRVAAAIARQGHYVLFVGTKRQARPVVQHQARRCGMPYVTERWPGGLLTNYGIVRQRLERLEELEELERTGEIERYSKKMISSLRRQRRKIERNLGGVRDMDRLPGLVVMVDPRREGIAVRETVKLAIPTIAWIDTDGDPEGIDVVVPANDDAMGSIEIFTCAIADAVLEGLQEAKIGTAVGRQPAETEPDLQPQTQQGPAEQDEQKESEQAEVAEVPSEAASESRDASSQPQEASGS